MIEARLLVVDGGASWEVPLGNVARELTIGRRHDCAIRLDDASASRAHAMLRVADGGQVFLRDLGSANGTRVNGDRIDVEVPLVQGDAAQIGGAMLHLMRQPAPAARDAILPPKRRATNERTLLVGGQRVLVADEQMAHAYGLLERLASSSVSILLAGETGVGKEVAARLVHERSPRRDGPFVAVNCSAIASASLRRRRKNRSSRKRPARTSSSRFRCWLTDERLFWFSPEALEIREVPCETRRLDDLDLRPSFVKIDVQGFEYQVCKGGIETLKAHQPVLMIEDFYGNEKLVELLAGIGYQAFDFSTGSFRPTDRTDAVNTFLLTPRRIEMLRDRGVPIAA